MNPHPEEDLKQLFHAGVVSGRGGDPAGILNAGLLALERSAGSPQAFDVLMRAAHSLKGAARIVNLQAAVSALMRSKLFVAAQRGRLILETGTLGRVIPRGRPSQPAAEGQ